MKPSADIRQMFELAREMESTSMAHEIAARLRLAIERMRGYLMLVEEAASRFDKTTFRNPARERIVAKDELAELLELDRQLEEWIKEEHSRK